MTKTQFKKFSLAVLAYTVIVILWGAWVRISHSGDGCGDSWPLCHGQIIPNAQQGKTWVEFGHRIMSGIYGIVIVLFWRGARKTFDQGHLARKAALATLLFMITEALLGAKLVLSKLVTTNDTPFRAFVMALHQLNSFMLTGAVALTFAAALQNADEIKIRKNRFALFLPWVIVVIGITGAWASLSNTLFPSENLWTGLMQDFSQDSHFLVRLRILHPLFALLGGGALALFLWIKSQTEENTLISARAFQMSMTILGALCFGVFTLLLHAPVWMKIVHLAIAHILWSLFVQWVYFSRYQK